MANKGILISLLLSFAIIGTKGAPGGLSPVNLGLAGNFVILSQSGVTTTGASSITGHIGVSPIAASSMTGFNLVLSSDGTKSSSSIVSGDIFAADYRNPTPSDLQTAIADSQQAYNDAAGRNNPDYLNIGGGNLNGVTLTPGLYRWGSGLNLGGTVTLSGSSRDVFIFQIAGVLTFGPDSNIVFAGGLRSENIFWQAQAANLGSGASVKGIILSGTAIVFGSGANLSTGRALAGTAVTLIGNTIRSP